jgi:hypothetical protein
MARYIERFRPFWNLQALSKGTRTFIIVNNKYLFLDKTPDDDVGLLQYALGELVLVFVLVYDLRYTGVEEDLRAKDAREVGRVYGGILDADPEICCLDDRVLLGVHPSAQLMPST